MIVRCERCSTLYELDESLLAPEGSPVQCTRCQHVFTVVRPRPGEASKASPVGDPVTPGSSTRSAEREEEPGTGPLPPSVPGVSPPSVRPPTRTAPARPQGPPVYRPPTSQPSVSRPPLIRRDTIGAFENRLRWSHRWRWLAPTVFGLLVAAGAAAFLLRGSKIDPRAREAHAGAIELALRDDLSSLEQARARLDEVLRSVPRLHAARADLALVELLLAGALYEQAEDVGGARGAELHERGKAHAERGMAALEELERGDLAPGEVARARTVAAALGQDRVQVKRLATAARGQLPNDPLVEAAECSAEIRSGDRASRERAIGSLSLLVARRPDVIRARYLLARGQFLSGRRAEALATTEALLKANPNHEAALALRETLTRPPPPVPTQPAAGAPTAPPPAAKAEKPAAPPRKPAPAAGEAAAERGGNAAGSARRTTPPPPPAPKPAEEEAAPVAPAEGSPAAADRAPPAEGEPAPRLRPAAVPEPEPVQGGG